MKLKIIFFIISLITICFSSTYASNMHHALPQQAVYIAKTKAQKLSWKERLLEKWILKKANKIEGEPHRPQHWSSFLSTLLGVGGLFIGGIPLGLTAIIFGLIGMSKSGKNKKFSGEGLAIFGFIVGIIAFGGAFVVLMNAGLL
jgi:hypothetical protein